MLQINQSREYSMQPSYYKHRSHRDNNFQTYPGMYEQRTLNYSQGFMTAENFQAESNVNFSSDSKKKFASAYEEIEHWKQVIIRSLVLRTSI